MCDSFIVYICCLSIVGVCEICSVLRDAGILDGSDSKESIAFIEQHIAEQVCDVPHIDELNIS